MDKGAGRLAACRGFAIQQLLATFGSANFVSFFAFLCVFFSAPLRLCGEGLAQPKDKT
jgi:hypothetical protein